MVLLLLEEGAVRPRFAFVAARDKPLDLCDDTAEQFFGRGFDPQQSSALCLAVKAGRRRLFRQLLEHGARANDLELQRLLAERDTPPFYKRVVSECGNVPRNARQISLALAALRVARVVFVRERGALFESLGAARWLDFNLLDAFSAHQLAPIHLHVLLQIVHSRAFFRQGIVEFVERIFGWRYLSALHVLQKNRISLDGF